MVQANNRGMFEERREKAILRRETERKESDAKIMAQYEASDDIRFRLPGVKMDAEYLDLANRASNGDKDAEAKAQRMVDEAAKRAGLMGPLWTGSAYTNITKFNEPETGIFFTPQENVALAYSKMHGRTNGGTYKVFLRVNNIKHVDFNGKEWFDYQADPENSDTYLQARLAKQQGFDAVLFTNIGVNQQQEWVVFFSAQIKSADPVTYDDAGRIIPLSERFNEARKAERRAAGMKKRSPVAGIMLAAAALGGGYTLGKN